MKKLMIALVLTMLMVGVLPGVSMAAENSLIINPLGLMTGSISAQYERGLGRDVSVLFAGSVAGSTDGETSAAAFGFGAGSRWYTSGEALTGFFLGGNASLVLGGASNDYASAGVAVFGLGGEVGYKWIISDSFTIEVGAGATALLAGASGSDGSTASGVGIAPTLGFGVGFAW